MLVLNIVGKKMMISNLTRRGVGAGIGAPLCHRPDSVADIRPRRTQIMSAIDLVASQNRKPVAVTSAA